MLFCWDKAEQDRQAGQEEVAARHWLSVLQVDREYEVPRIRDVGVRGKVEERLVEQDKD